jgi:CRP-like cAMP-binding protein
MPEDIVPTDDPNDGALAPWFRRLRLRTNLTVEELTALGGLPFAKRRYDANRDFVRLGECVTHACVVVSGIAGRFDQTASGARQITALHIPGDAADLHSVPVPRASNALQALTRTEVAHIPHDALRELVAEYPNIALAFWRDCVIDAAILSKWSLNLGRASARQRIAHLLCELSLRYGAIGRGGDRFDFPATQIHIGDATGLTNVHVNRVMRELGEDGLARVRGGRVEIFSVAGLAKEGDFDASYLHLADH